MAALVACVALTGCSEDRDPVSDDGDAPTPACSPSELIECARDSSIAPLVLDSATAADGEPIVIGMVNQENTPAGSFPELSAAAQAFVAWINEELGGVDGRPLRLDVCNTGFSAEGSTRCGQQFVQAGVPVVLGGIDVFGNAVDVLAENGIPYVGGIPVSQQSMTNANSFQWSGGTWGATVAFAAHAAEAGAERVAIVYGDFGSIAQSATYGKATLEANDVEVQLVPFPVVATDVAAFLQAAVSGRPDAIFMLTADAGCGSAFDTARTLGITATMYYVGACAAPTITDAAGTEATEGAIFNVEGPVVADLSAEGVTEVASADNALYNSVLAAHAPDLNPIGAATVAARSMVNLYSVLRELGAEAVSARTITEALRDAADVPSFMGHPYTCDGDQLAGLPATCAPQQILARMEGGELSQVDGWVDVGAVYPG